MSTKNRRFSFAEYRVSHAAPPSRIWTVASPGGYFIFGAVLQGSSIESRVRALLKNYPYETDEPKATEIAIHNSMAVIKAVGKNDVSQPEVSVNYGELELAWSNGKKAVRLLSDQLGNLRIHEFESRAGEPSFHRIIEAVTPLTLSQSLRWVDRTAASRRWQPELVLSAQVGG